MVPAATLFWRTGSLVRSLPAVAIFVTSVAKYNFDVLHAVDLATVAVCTPSMFVLNPVTFVSWMCLAWNVAVFCIASTRSCAWHATIHVSTGVAIGAWAVQ